MWPWQGDERLSYHKMLEMLAVNRLAIGGRCLRDMVSQSTSYKRNGQFRKKPLLQALCWAWEQLLFQLWRLYILRWSYDGGGTAGTAASDIYCWNIVRATQCRWSSRKTALYHRKAHTATTSPGSTGRTDVNMAQFSIGFQNGQGLARHWENIQLFFDKS